VDYERSARFDAAPAQVAEARNWLTGSLHAALPSAVAEPLAADAVLAVSELATNSLRAGSAWFTVGFTLEANCLKLGVRDSAGGTPLQRNAQRTDVNGRGLAIVSALATDWGTVSLSDGKEVWVVLPIPSAG